MFKNVMMKLLLKLLYNSQVRIMHVSLLATAIKICYIWQSTVENLWNMKNWFIWHSWDRASLMYSSKC